MNFPIQNATSITFPIRLGTWSTGLRCQILLVLAVRTLAFVSGNLKAKFFSWTRPRCAGEIQSLLRELEWLRLSATRLRRLGTVWSQGSEEFARLKASRPGALLAR